MARVSLHNLSKVYPGGVRAVNNVSLEIADQEFVVLVGPSGCGKTTTLRMIAGLEEITSGTIRIGDRVVNDVAPKDRDIAMVFQNYALYPHMTVYGNMSFALRLRMMPGLLQRFTQPAKTREIKDEIRRRVHHAADILEIRDLLHRKPRELSGGQKQRVAVGRAIVREPAAFLFDEPLSNLDAKLRITTRAELKRLHRRLKTTTIYVTHDQEEAMTLGDRIVVMKDGVIQQADTPLQTYKFPANRFVAGFIGMPPMNFFEGRIQAEGGDLFFEEEAPAAGFRLPLNDLPASLLGEVRSRARQPVIMGVRPEHLAFAEAKSSDAGTAISTTVHVVEPLGNDMDVYVGTASHPHIIVRTLAQQAIEPGQQINIVPDMTRIHFFEPGDSGAAIR
jgi:multiple sugar transport system ATP-binding protein